MRWPFAIRVLAGIILASLAPAWAAAEQPPLPQVVGETRSVRARAGDTLMEIAAREGFGFDMVARSNRRHDPWSLPADAEITLPARAIVPAGAQRGIMINLAELRLFHIHGAGLQPRVDVYPLGIGREGRETPEGVFRIVVKKEKPFWRVPQGLRKSDPGLPEVVAPGILNPLGDYWLGLSVAGYGIHGTNRPYGVGRRISYGCLRMYPKDISRLYHQVGEGTLVTISYQPVKAARHEDQLLLEVHDDYLNRYVNLFQLALDTISGIGWRGEIDYGKVRAVVADRKSQPEVIGRLRPSD